MSERISWADALDLRCKAVRQRCTPMPSPVSSVGFTLLAGDKPWASFRDYHHADEAARLMSKNLPELGPFSVRVDQGWLMRRWAV